MDADSKLAQKQKDLPFRDIPGWRDSRFAQSEEQINNRFRCIEHLGTKDMADDALKCLEKMYRVCATYMDNRSYTLAEAGEDVTPVSDPFVGWYTDFGGATLWCVLALQAALAHSPLTEGYQVGSETAAERWSVRNLHALLSERHKGDTFTSQIGVEDLDEAHTSIGGGQSGKRGAVNRALHHHSSTTKRKKVRVDNLGEDKDIARKIRCFAHVWALTFGDTRPLCERIREGLPPTAFYAMASSVQARRLTGTALAKAQGFAERVNATTASASFGPVAARARPAHAEPVVPGISSAAPKPKSAIVLKPSLPMKQRSEMKLTKQQQLEQEAMLERRNESETDRRHRSIREASERSSVIRDASKSVAAAAVANVKSIFANEYAEYRDENNHAEAEKQVAELSRRKHEVRDKCHDVVDEDGDGLMTTNVFSQAKYDALNAEEKRVYNMIVPDADELVDQWKRETPFASAGSSVQLKVGGVAAVLTTVAGKPRKRRSGGQPKLKPSEPPSMLDIALHHDFETAEEMEAYLAEMTRRGTTSTGGFVGWTTNHYEEWELELHHDVFTWLPKQKRLWEVHLASEAEKNRSKKHYECNPYERSGRILDEAKWVERRSQNMIERRDAELSRLERDERRDDRREAKRRKTEEKKAKQLAAFERRELKAQAKGERLEARGKRSVAKLEGRIKEYFKREQARATRAAQRFEDEYGKAIMKGKCCALHKPLIDEETGCLQRDKDGEPVMHLLFLPATGRNLHTRPYTTIVFKIAGASPRFAFDGPPGASSGLPTLKRNFLGVDAGEWTSDLPDGEWKRLKCEAYTADSYEAGETLPGDQSESEACADDADVDDLFGEDESEACADDADVDDLFGEDESEACTDDADVEEESEACTDDAGVEDESEACTDDAGVEDESEACTDYADVDFFGEDHDTIKKTVTWAKRLT